MKNRKKGTGYFFYMNCPQVEKALFLTEKVACPLFLPSDVTITKKEEKG